MINLKRSLQNSLVGGLAALVLMASGCGQMQKFKEQDLHYRTLTGKTGDVILYSGGELVGKYPDAKIIYSSSDTRAIWFRVNGKDFYWQGDALIELK